MEIRDPVLQFRYVALEAAYFAVVACRAQPQARQFLRLMIERLLQQGALGFQSCDAVG